MYIEGCYQVLDTVHYKINLKFLTSPINLSSDGIKRYEIKEQLV